MDNPKVARSFDLQKIAKNCKKLQKLQKLQKYIKK